MRPTLLVSQTLLALALSGCARDEGRGAAPATPPDGTKLAALPQSLHELTMNRLDGKPESLGTYEGKVLLVVNTASECGNTPQYEGLQKLYEELSPKGLVVLGFPSNDFGGQEPGSSDEIATFCRKNYGVTFPMFEKVKTTGGTAAPLYVLLAAKAGEPKWNFHKYLVDKKGHVVRSFSSSVAPESTELRAAIAEQLAN